jgi:hypothetical protein
VIRLGLLIRLELLSVVLEAGTQYRPPLQLKRQTGSDLIVCIVLSLAAISLRAGLVVEDR